MDLQGPKIRVDQLDGTLDLKVGDLYFLGKKDILDPIDSDKKIFSDYEYIFDDLNVGERVLFDDGKITAKCTEKKDGYLVIEILNDGVLKPRKGINLT